MNEELKILMGIMNGEIDPTKAMMAGGDPEQLNGGGGQQATSTDTLNTGFGEPQEIEITEEMKASANGVVNKARGRNRISGVTEFLQNPEIQNALITFGQAIAGAGQPGGKNAVNVIGDVARQGIQQQANQRGLEAFEQGEDPAAAAGRFADPELMSNLQGRQQQQQQFEEQMELERDRIGIEEEALRRDSVFQAAKFMQNDKLATAEMENMKKQTEIDQQIADARQDYWEALANREQGDNENLALRTNEYLQVLNQQDQVLEDSITNTVDALDEIEVEISDQQLKQLKNGVISISDINISDADNSSWPLNTGNGQALAQNLLSELGTNIKAQQTHKAQINALKSSQTERLTGKGEEDIEEERQQMIPGNTPDNPLPVATAQQAMSKTPGTYVNYGGVVYEVLEGNKRRRVGPAN